MTMTRSSMMTTSIVVMLLFCFVSHMGAFVINGPLRLERGLCSTFVHDTSYTCEEYQIQTQDGFILGVQRMYKTSFTSKRKPVLLLHGVLSGGDSWFLLPSPSKCLPFMLGEAGYDVWIGNSRTSNYGGGHVTLKRTSQAFWNWSVDEMAAFDLPAMFGLVSNITTWTPHFIGYSQGAQIALAAFANGQSISVVDKVALLAPASYMNSISLTLSAASDLYMADDLLSVGVAEYTLKANTDLMAKVCATSVDANCTSDTVASITGPNCCVDDSTMASYNSHGESTSTKNMVHFSQQHRAKSFAKYDYGVLQNGMVYKSSSPPSYNLAAIPYMPLMIIHGGKDGLASTKDVSLLLEKLSFAPQEILLAKYGHLDFILGSKVDVDCYPKVVNFLR